MALLDEMKARLEQLKQLRPENLKKLSNEKLIDFIDTETVRSRKRIDELVTRFPSATGRELSQHIIEQKKQLASMVGGITGIFGIVTVPLDLGGMVYLQLSLLIDIALIFKANPRSDKARGEMLDVFGESNGIGPLERSTPKVMGSLAALLLSKGGLKTLSRAMPMVAAPISAYLNTQHIQRVGEAAIRHYDGWPKARAKARDARES